mgnify:CR=1 FL=1
METRKYYGIRLSESTYRKLIKIKARIMEQTGEYITFDQIIKLLAEKYEEESLKN